METKLWTILLIVSAMAAVTKQMDLLSIMGFNKKDKLTTVPPPFLDAYGQPQPGFASVNKFDQTKQELKILTKQEKEQDKLFKLQQKQPMINSTYNPHGLAIGPVENPVQYGAPPQNYTAHRAYDYHKPGFNMVVAEVVINGSFEYKRQTKSVFKDLGPEFAKDKKKHNSIQGTLFISEIYPSICLVSGVVTGLPPNSKFGVAIHSFGDVTNGCQSIGPHYNPDDKQHGNINAPDSHAGDLGNLRSNAAGVAFVNKITRNQFSILGKKQVAGRSVGICERQDDLGLGGNVQSLRDRNCGQILACGLIELANTGAMSKSGHY